VEVLQAQAQARIPSSVGAFRTPAAPAPADRVVMQAASTKERRRPLLPEILPTQIRRNPGEAIRRTIGSRWSRALVLERQLLALLDLGIPAPSRGLSATDLSKSPHIGARFFEINFFAGQAGPRWCAL